MRAAVVQLTLVLVAGRARADVEGIRLSIAVSAGTVYSANDYGVFGCSASACLGDGGGSSPPSDILWNGQAQGVVIDSTSAYWNSNAEEVREPVPVGHYVRGDARILLDNNATERGIRGPVVGRKNHYGSKSRRGTEIAAVFYTLLETAKLVGAEPAKYLREAALANARRQVLLPADMQR